LLRKKPPSRSERKLAKIALEKRQTGKGEIYAGGEPPLGGRGVRVFHQSFPGGVPAKKLGNQLNLTKRQGRDPRKEKKPQGTFSTRTGFGGALLQEQEACFSYFLGREGNPWEWGREKKGGNTKPRRGEKFKRWGFLFFQSKPSRRKRTTFPEQTSKGAVPLF